MPVFDFTNAPADKKQGGCTYETIRSNEAQPTAEQPIMLLDNAARAWKHHSCGVFTNPSKRTSFEFQEEDGTFSADIRRIDARFVGLLKWLGENHINVRLSGSIQDPRDRIRWWNKAVSRGWIFTVYDRPAAREQCAGGRSRR